MKNLNSTLTRLTWLILLLTAFVLGIKQLREPDIWWQLRTGEWIVQHGKVMDKDVFSYSYEGTAWKNVKWGTEVIYYGLYQLGGPEFTPVLQSIVSVLLLWMLWLLYKELHKRLFAETKVSLSPSFLLTAVLFLLATAYRMNGRPEMMSHLFTAVFLLLLLSHRYSSSKWIWLIIPLQVLWTNLHEAYGIGMVLTVSFTIGAWLEYLLRAKYSSKAQTPPFQLSLVTGLSILSTTLHPYGWHMILHPIEIFSQVGANKFTTELVSFTHYDYWHKEAFLNLFFGIFSVISLIFIRTSQHIEPGNKVIRQAAHFGFGYLLILVLFFYLSLTAYRNIPFFIIVSAPLVAHGLFQFGKAAGIFNGHTLKVGFRVLLLAVAILFYIAITSGFYYKHLEDDRNHYGLRIDPLMNPIGPSDFIRQNRIQGPCFSDFLVSNYLLWDLRPGFKTFIDLRDLDVFPAEFFHQFGLLTMLPENMEMVDSIYHFNYAVLYTNNFKPLHKYFNESPHWALVYASPVAVVFLKKNEINTALIKKTGSLREGVDVYHAVVEKPSTGMARAISKMFWPFKAKDFAKEVNYDLLAANYEQSIGAFDQARKHAQKASLENIADARRVLGDTYLMEAASDTLAGRRNFELSWADSCYEEELALHKNNVDALIGLGRTALQRQDFLSAQSYFQQAIKKDAGNANAYILLSQTMNGLMAADASNASTYLEKNIQYLKKALVLDPENTNLKFYLGIACAQHGDCDEAADLLDDLSEYNVPQRDKNLAKKLLAGCGK